MFCPCAVEGGIFIKTEMSCSQTGGIIVGEQGVIKVGLVSGGLARGGGGGWRPLQQLESQRGCQGTLGHPKLLSTVPLLTFLSFVFIMLNLLQPQLHVFYGSLLALLLIPDTPASLLHDSSLTFLVFTQNTHSSFIRITV